MSTKGKYVWIVPALVVNFVLFQNFSGCESRVAFQSKTDSMSLYQGGSGEPTDGKPDATFYREVDGFKCKGEAARIGEVQIKRGAVTGAKVLDPESCEMKNVPATAADLTFSALDSDAMGFHGGIYARSTYRGAANEAWCRDISGKKVELLVKNDGRSLEFFARIDGRNALGPLPVRREADAGSVRYVSDKLNLMIDRISSLSAPTVAGRLHSLQDSGLAPDLDLSCRFGATLDAYNHFAPAESAEFFGPTLPAGFSLARASSATYFDQTGVMRLAAPQTPRFDSDPGTGLRRGLLIENRSTNLFTNSQRLDQWQLTGLNVTADTNEVAAVTGVSDAELFRNTSVVAQHQVMQRVSLNPGSFYTFSVFIKPTAVRPQRLVRLQIIDDATLSNQIWAGFDLSTGTVDLLQMGGDGHSASATVQKLRDGWMRLSLSGVPSETSSYMQVFFQSMDQDNTMGIYADPVQSGFYAWGAQIEEGRSGTSYIQTGSTPVRREADTLTSNDLSWWNASVRAGSLMLERETASAAGSSGQPHALMSLMAGANDFWSFLFDPGLSLFSSRLTSGNGLFSQVSVTAAASSRISFIGAFSETASSVTVNGQSADTGLSSLATDAPDRILIDAGDPASDGSDHLQALRYWPFYLEEPVRARLTSGELPE